MRDHPVATLSLGWKQRLSIASMLALDPKVLFLDEPTSYLDEPTADLLFDVLSAQTQQHGLTVLVIEHDLARLRPWASRLVAMRHGQMMFDSPPDSYSPPARLLAEPAAESGVGEVHGGERALSVDRVTFGYNGSQPALDNVSFSIATGEIVALTGPNGSGKTTLLNLVKGLFEPDGGRITGADNVSRMDSVGLVFQNPDTQLFAHSVFEECSFLPRNQGFPAVEISSRTRQALNDVGLPSLADRVPFSLSYGEKRRLTLASVLSGRSPLLCLDEPTVGLDDDSLVHVAAVLRQFTANGGAVLMATHDTEFANAVATRRLTLRAGRIVADTSAPRRTT